MISLGNDPKFPKLPDGSRDLDRQRSHVDTYLEMEKLMKTGKVKAIGVCNYSERYLKELLPKVSIVPAANQIENHPQLPQQEIVDLCKEKGILITAYSPLGSTGSPLMTLPEVEAIAKKHGVTTGSVLLSYHGRFCLLCLPQTLLIACQCNEEARSWPSQSQTRVSRPI